MPFAEEMNVSVASVASSFTTCSAASTNSATISVEDIGDRDRDFASAYEEPDSTAKYVQGSVSMVRTETLGRKAHEGLIVINLIDGGSLSFFRVRALASLSLYNTAMITISFSRLCCASAPKLTIFYFASRRGSLFFAQRK